jgi:hypothetical protein
MTTTIQPTSVEYIGVENGLTFKITIFQEAGGEFHAQIEVLEGSADFNALYFGDDVLDGNSFSFGKSLGMNGAGQTDQYGNPVDWDSGIKLSDPGLGKLGIDKPTYLTAGETMIVSLPGVDSWDDVTEIGVRGTSTSTPSGSIKTVLEPVEVIEEPEEPSVIEGPPATVDVIEAPSVVAAQTAETPPSDPPPSEIVTTEPVEEVPPAAAVSDVPVDEPVSNPPAAAASDVPVDEIVSDVPAEEPISDVPTDETVGDAPANDTPVDPSPTPDADAAYYEDFANTVGIVDDYVAYPDDQDEIELAPDMVF